MTGWRREQACSFADTACKPGHWHRFISYSGPIVYEVAKGYYFKFGIYTVRPFESLLIVYHRAYQRGPNPYAVGLQRISFGHPIEIPRVRSGERNSARSLRAHPL